MLNSKTNKPLALELKPVRRLLALKMADGQPVIPAELSELPAGEMGNNENQIEQTKPVVSLFPFQPFQVVAEGKTFEIADAETAQELARAMLCCDEGRYMPSGITFRHFLRACEKNALLVVAEEAAK